MSIDSVESKKFAAKFKKRWGSERVVADPQESAYNMVYLWKKAVEKAGTFDDEAVRAALIGVTFDAPQGPIKVMPNHHISQTVRIGQINAEGGFTILDEYTSDGAVIPQTWNQFYPEDIGYGCDWSEGGGGRKYEL